MKLLFKILVTTFHSPKFPPLNTPNLPFRLLEALLLNLCLPNVFDLSRGTLNNLYPALRMHQSVYTARIVLTLGLPFSIWVFILSIFPKFLSYSPYFGCLPVTQFLWKLWLSLKNFPNHGSDCGRQTLPITNKTSLL